MQFHSGVESFENVFVQGGIQQWEKEGLPLYAMYSDDDDDFQDGLGEVSAQTTATA